MYLSILFPLSGSIRRQDNVSDPHATIGCSIRVTYSHYVASILLSYIYFPLHNIKPTCPVNMAPDPDFDHEVHEDAPFLASASNTPGPQPETKPRHETARDASVIGLRLKVTLFAMVLAVEVGFAFLEGPMVRIMEAIACRQYYGQTDPTKIGANGQVPEEMCKVAEVQAELAAVKGYHMFFDGLLCMG